MVVSKSAEAEVGAVEVEDSVAGARRRIPSDMLPLDDEDSVVDATAQTQHSHKINRLQAQGRMNT